MRWERAWTAFKALFWACIVVAFVRGWLATGNSAFNVPERALFFVALPIAGWFAFLFREELNIRGWVVAILFAPTAIWSFLLAVSFAILAYDPTAFAK